jgi:hypothetical protein
MTPHERELGVATVARFMDAFNAIESHLRRGESDGRRRSFHDLVGDARIFTPQQARRLKDISDLRNAIVHNPGGWNSVPIAVPRDDVVDWLVEQAELVMSPPTVMGVLKPKKPHIFAARIP